MRAVGLNWMVKIEVCGEAQLTTSQPHCKR